MSDQLIPLNAEQIKAALDDTSKLADLEVLPEVASSNSYLLDQPIELGCARVCLAEAQTSGRGRHGNSWQSTPDRNLMMSLSWRFAQWPETITSLSLAVSLIIAERLNAQYDIGITIKWPNDLMVASGQDSSAKDKQSAKLAGILVDLSGSAKGPCSVVIGLGLNVHQADWSKQSRSDYPWQDLYGLGVKVDRNQLAADIINDLLVLLPHFEEHGFTQLYSRWNKLSGFTDKRVVVGDSGCGSDMGNAIEGIMQGVDLDGALLVKDDNGKQQRIVDTRLSVRLL